MTRGTLTAGEIAALGFRYRHPLDPQAEVNLVALSRLSGLKRTGVNLTRIAPGRHAFPFHRHMVEEEWVFVISGTAEIRHGSKTFTLEAGGFCAFPPDGRAHWVANPGPEDLVCLMGGESRDAETVDFPDAGKRVTRTPGGGTEIQALDTEPFDFFSITPPPGRDA